MLSAQPEIGAGKRAVSRPGEGAARPGNSPATKAPGRFAALEIRVPGRFSVAFGP